ncbi:MAG: MFS transporter [SAR202 cluster bacterium]|nr:MFS transporter [Dehalococcoidia bacterium]MQF89594.1 MFS transporter [SAR202 cluster bacterium]
MYQLLNRMPFFYGWTILFAAGSSMVVRNATASLTLAVFIFPMSEDLGWSRTLIAGAASLGGLVATVASPVVGWTLDRYGARTILTVSILVLGLSTISLAWATVPIAFYLAYGTGRVLFSSPLNIGPSVVVSRWFVRRRGRATGMLFLSHSLGMITFPLIAGLVIKYRGWEDAWIVLGVLVWVLALGPVSMLIRQSPESVGLLPDGDLPEQPGAGNDVATAVEEVSWTLREAMRTPTLWLLALATGSLFLLQSGTNIHQGAYFLDQGLGVGVSAATLSVNAVFTGAGSLFWGWLVDRVPVRFTYAGVALMMAVALVLFPSADSAIEALVVAAIFGAAVGGILVVPVVAYANYFGRRSLSAIRGVTEPFVSLGQAIGAIFSGAIYDVTGSYKDAFLILAILGFATIGMLLLTRAPVRPGVETEAGES